MPAAKTSHTRARSTTAASWETLTLRGVRVAVITQQASERILDALADQQLVPAPVAQSRGGPTFVLSPLQPGGMVARDVVLSATESGLIVIATFGIGLYGTSNPPPPDQRLALLSSRQLELARSNSGWVLLIPPSTCGVLAC